MQQKPLRTSVIGSYPLPGWLEMASGNLDQFGPDDIEEIQRDAVTAAVCDQIASGVDVLTDGEQTRFDFNLSFYGYLQGIDLEAQPPRRWGPPAHDQRGRHAILDRLSAPDGLGTSDEFRRLQSVAAAIAPARCSLKASVPGPFTLSGRLLPNDMYPDRFAVTEALLPIVRDELIALADAGCQEICLDEPSMSCYGHLEETARLVDIFNRTVAGVRGRCRVDAHLCFGNYKGRAVGSGRPECLFPEFLQLDCDELHLEMATLRFRPLALIEEIAKHMDVAVGIVDVKSYYIETPDEIADQIRQCLKLVPPERLVLAPDCGLSQTARWAARKKLANMVKGATIVKRELGCD